MKPWHTVVIVPLNWRNRVEKIKTSLNTCAGFQFVWSSGRIQTVRSLGSLNKDPKLRVWDPYFKILKNLFRLAILNGRRQSLFTDEFFGNIRKKTPSVYYKPIRVQNAAVTQMIDSKHLIQQMFLKTVAYLFLNEV